MGMRNAAVLPPIWRCRVSHQAGRFRFLERATTPIAYRSGVNEPASATRSSYKRNCKMAEALRSEFLCSLTGFVAPPRDIGATPRGTRRYYPVIRGSFEGPRLRGEVLPDGGDWLLMRPDGVLEQDVRARQPYAMRLRNMRISHMQRGTSAVFFASIIKP